MKLKKKQLKALKRLKMYPKFENEGCPIENGFIDFAFLKSITFNGSDEDLEVLLKLFEEIQNES